jgi:TFIIF-interacting CTD phosphatase-like protein
MIEKCIEIVQKSMKNDRNSPQKKQNKNKKSVNRAFLSKKMGRNIFFPSFNQKEKMKFYIKNMLFFFCSGILFQN